MIDYAATFQHLEKAFSKEGIPTRTPGFYDHPRFLCIERSQPDLLNCYARYVDTKSYSPEYLEHAAQIIRTAAGELRKLLKRDGRKGACIDCSMALSRMLDKEGIWNYAVKGATTIAFPKATGFPTFSFWPISEDNGSPGQFGHKWVCAPPFKIVDITIQQQDYQRPISAMLPPFVLADCGQKTNADATDIW